MIRDYFPKNGSIPLWITRYVTAPTKAEQGIVRIQAITIRSPQIQRTLRTPFIVPTPRIDPVIACVVLIGMPRCVATMIVEAADVSAQKPPTGANRVIPDPIVFTMRHPPKNVPSAIAPLQV